jgi:hypothetical protein
MLKFTLLLIVVSFGFKSLAQSKIELGEQQAHYLSQLPLKCLQQEYPNKLGQVLNSSAELKEPSDLHPTFYGCFDWHSSVHGHWLLVRLLKSFPNLSNADTIRMKLNEQFTKAKILQETQFFTTKFNESFERTYGWAWLLKLQEELNSWEDKDAKIWKENLQPLTDLIVTKYKVYLPKLVYAIRTGEHVNTAFGLSFAHDYAKSMNDTTFQLLIEKRAKEFYLSDRNYPLTFEPSGYDFLSPAFEEAELMQRVLNAKDYSKWLKQFLPQIYKRSFKLEPGKVSDRTDGKLVHLDGLNFSRSWCLYQIASSDKRLIHLEKVADYHLSYSLPFIVDGDYMGEHWLASFAVYALITRNQKTSN